MLWLLAFLPGSKDILFDVNEHVSIWGLKNQLNDELIKMSTLSSEQSTNETIDLMNYDLKSLKKLLSQMGQKPFRAKQVFKWIHQKGITDFDQMSDLARSFREQLKTFATVDVPKVIYNKHSNDGTYKWLLQMSDGNCIETVFIPDGKRGTLCVSSQVGCILNCSFCATGKQGFSRNLSVGEIIAQVWVAVQGLKSEASEKTPQLTNIVMMGMGEPLLNYDNLVPALAIMRDDHGYGLSKRRVTVSTSGIVPKMYQLLNDSEVSLAVSLHASNDALRNELVPLNKKYRLDELMQACKTYADEGPQNQVTFEYTLIHEINDSLTHAQELKDLLESYHMPSKINLIPFNPYPGTIYQRPSNNRLHRFQKYLLENGFLVTLRRTRGDDIDAACGQLVGSVNDRTNRQSRHRASMVQ